jgi:glycosyltransferase involved in cell wall biosynthesis
LKKEISREIEGDKLSIIVPVFNEDKNFPLLYSQIKNRVKVPYHIIVVYDFDEDTTLPIIREIQLTDKDLILVKNRLGKGALNALKAGFNYVKKGPIVVTMSDLSDDPKVINLMYKKYLEGYDIVCGSRYMKGGSHSGGAFLKKVMSKIAGLSLYYIRGFPTHDVTNNFKLYNKAFLESIDIESKGGFEISMEITIKAFKRNKAIAEVPASWKDRSEGESNFKLWKWLPSYLKWYLIAFF